MATATINFFNEFAQDYGSAVHGDPSTQTFKVMLTLTAPVATNSVKADLTEIAAGNGYTAGGNTCNFVSFNQSGGVATLILADPAPFVASGGPMAPFRYVVLYNDTPTNPADPLICWWDFGATVNLADTQPFPISLNQTTGVFQVQTGPLA